MAIFDSIWNSLGVIVRESHSILLVVPVIAIGVAFGLGFFTLAYSIIIEANKEKLWIKRYKINAAVILLDKFEWIAFLAIVFTQIAIGFVIASGIYTAGTFEDAINNHLLEITIRLSIQALILLLTPIFLKLYFEGKFKKDMFQDSPRIVPILYLTPQLIALILLILSSQAGMDYNSN